MLLPNELGGLKINSTKYVCSTAHIMFIKRWCNGIEARWKVLTEFLMGLNVSEIFDERCLLTFHTCIKTNIIKPYSRPGLI